MTAAQNQPKNLRNQGKHLMLTWLLPTQGHHGNSRKGNLGRMTLNVHECTRSNHFGVPFLEELSLK